MKKQIIVLSLACTLLLSVCLINNSPSQAKESDYYPREQYPSLFDNSFSKPQNPPLFEPVKCTPEQKRLLAFGAVLITRNGLDYLTLSGLGSDADAVTLGAMQMSIYWSWGIEDRESAISKLNDLQHHGHRYTTASRTGYNQILDALKAYNKLDSDLQKDLVYAKAGYDDVCKTLKKNYKYTAKELNKVQTLSAWDYDRMVAVSQMCYNLRYISEKEFLNCIKWVEQEATKEYGSWREYFAAVMIGRTIWSQNKYMSNEDKNIADMLLNKSKSIYKTVSFKKSN